MKIRIESDGTPTGTHVFTETGREIKVKAVSWNLSAMDELADVELTIPGPLVELAVEGNYSASGRDFENLPGAQS